MQLPQDLNLTNAARFVEIQTTDFHGHPPSGQIQMSNTFYLAMVRKITSAAGPAKSVSRAELPGSLQRSSACLIASLIEGLRFQEHGVIIVLSRQSNTRQTVASVSESGSRRRYWTVRKPKRSRQFHPVDRLRSARASIDTFVSKQDHYSEFIGRPADEALSQREWATDQQRSLKQRSVTTEKNHQKADQRMSCALD